jgi:hypothetical protein
MEIPNIILLQIFAANKIHAKNYRNVIFTLSSSDFTACNNFGSHMLQDGLTSFELGGWATDHESQRTGSSCSDTAGDRRINED